MQLLHAISDTICIRRICVNVISSEALVSRDIYTELLASPSAEGQRPDLRGPMHRAASQQLLADSVVHVRESSSVIGDPDARHVAAFCVSTTIRTLRERPH